MSSAGRAEALALALDDAVAQAGLDPRVGGDLATQARRCARLWHELDRGRLVVALFGGTGVGKSTLVNAIAGRTISRSGERRPTTDRIVCHRHRDAPPPEGIAPDDLVPDAGAHDVAALRDVVLLDLPDMDSYVTAHAERVERVLPEIDVLLVVASPEKYASRELFDALARLPQSRRSLVFVLNAIDRVPAAERERVRADFAQKIAAHTSAAGAPVLALSARDALEGGAAARAASGMDALLPRLHALGREGERRRVLLDNAREASRALDAELARVLPWRVLDDWVGSLEAIAARPLALDAATRGSLRESLADALRAPFAVRAEHASGFPIFELAWLRALLRRAVAAETSLAAPFSVLVAAEDRLVERPLAIARREAELAATPPPAIPLAPVPVPGAAHEDGRAGATVTTTGRGAAPATASPAQRVATVAPERGAALAGVDPVAHWQSTLPARAEASAWLLRQHVLPLLLALGAALWLALPAIVHALDPAAAGATTTRGTLVSLAERAALFPWLPFAIAIGVVYALVLPRFARRLRRVVALEAARGVEAFEAHAAARFETELAAEWRARVAARRRLADAVRAAHGAPD